MIDLAEHQAEGFIPLKLIADRQEISEKYLESIIKLLVKANLLVGLRGKGGGSSYWERKTVCQAKTAMPTVPSSSSPSPSRDFRFSLSPNTQQERSTVTARLILSMGTTTLTTPFWMA